jgi:hypothetical protein
MGRPLKDKWGSGAACEASWTWTRANVTTPLYPVFSPPKDTGIDLFAIQRVDWVRGFSNGRYIPG